MTPAQEFQRRYYEMLLKSQWWTAEQMAEYQRRQLTKLLNHARSTVPFYRDRLDAVFRPDGSIDFSRWTELPIVKRADLSARREEMLSEAPVAGHGRVGVIRTSGSTGDSVAMSHSQFGMLIKSANVWRSNVWHGVDWSKTLLNRVSDHPDREHGVLMGSWGPPWDEGARRGRSRYAGTSLKLEQLVDLMLESTPAYLVDYAHTIEPLAEVAARRAERVHLDAIMTYAEGATERDRQVAREVFGARILELYSSKEVGAIGYPCAEGPGFHVNAESMLVEIVDDNGRPSAAEEPGHVVLTPFGNSVLPLIRYDQGDMAVAGPPCVCGRCLPVIDRIAGRTVDVFTHPSGASASTILPASAKTLLNAAKFQVIQVGATEFEVRYTRKADAADADHEGFVRMFREHYFDDAQVVLKQVDDIPLQPSGKYLTYINEWSGRRRTRETTQAAGAGLIRVSLP
jgi:phenylacetate-CoA ligase